MPQPVTTAASQQQACAQTITTTALSPDTIVSIKDHGDSQTVLVYKIDDQGNVRLAGRTKTKY
jgi:hypothetical protein